MRVLVVLPTVNEVATIEEVIRRTRAAVPDSQVLVVDDDSSDGTADLAEKVGRDTGGVEVMRRPGRLGLGTAYRDGFRWGLDHGAEILVEMDSDLSHDPDALPQLIAALDGAGLVIGSRYVPGGDVPKWTWRRRMLSRYANRYSAAMLGVPVRDMTAGYRAYAAAALEALDLDGVHSQGYGFQIELAYQAHQAGVTITEVPIRFVDRELGKSKMSGKVIVEAMLLVTRWGIARRIPGARHRSQASTARLSKERSA